MSFELCGILDLIPSDFGFEYLGLLFADIDDLVLHVGNVQHFHHCIFYVLGVKFTKILRGIELSEN